MIPTQTPMLIRTLALLSLILMVAHAVAVRVATRKLPSLRGIMDVAFQW